MEKYFLVAFACSLSLLVLTRIFVKTKSKKIESWLVLLMFFLVTAIPFGYVGLGNIAWKGILSDSIMDSSDPVVLEDEIVADLFEEGLRTGDIIRFTIPFYKGLNKEELRFVYEFSRELSGRFYEYGVLGIANSSKYRVTEEEYKTENYLTDSIYDPSFDLAKWQEDLEEDVRMKSYLIGGDYQCAHVYLLLPRGYDEIKTYREVKAFLEGRKRGFFESLWYSDDIYLKSEYMTTDVSGQRREHVLPSGWTIGRGLMTDATVVDVILFSLAGQLLALLVFAFFFASWRQAFIASCIVWLSFFWIGGTVGLVLYLYKSTDLLAFLDLRVYLRIYIVLVCSANIVSGISFAERKLSFFNRLREKNPHISRAVLWTMSGPVNQRIFVTALIASLNFLTLRQIGVGPIWEVGFLSACGIVYLFLLSYFFIPALHILIGGEKKTKKGSVLSLPAIVLNRLLEKVVLWCYFRLVPDPIGDYRPHKPLAATMTILSIFFILAASIILIDLSGLRVLKDGSKLIEVRTKPLDYLDKTIVHRSYEYLKSLDEGFENLCLLVRPQEIDFEAYSDISYLENLRSLIERIEKHPEAKAVNSAIDALEVISREDYGVEFPQYEEDALTAFEDMSDMLGPINKSHLYYYGGIVLFVSVQMDDSKKLQDLVDHIRSLRDLDEFSELDIILFGKGAIWPRNDKKISTEKPINALTSYWLIFAIVFIWVANRNRNKLVGNRSMKPSLTAFALSLPFVFSSSIMLIAMAVFRLPLDQATACSASLAVSAAVDFSIYPIADYQDKILSGSSRRMALHYALVERGEEVVMDVILNCVCFLSLTISSFLPIRNLGWVMIAMLVACGVGSLLIMMSLLPFCVREEKYKRRSKNDDNSISIFTVHLYGD